MPKPKFKIEVTSSMGEEEVYFDILKFRVQPGGLEITARSPQVHDYMLSIAEKDLEGKPTFLRGRNMWDVGGYQYYRAHLPELEAEAPTVMMLDFNGYFMDGLANIPWLLHKSLGEGVQILIPKPMSLNNLEDYASSAAAQIQNFYRSYLCPAEISMTFKVIGARRD